MLDIFNDFKDDAIEIETCLDTDGDGIDDTLLTEIGIDTDGDGFIDTVMTEIGVDVDGDGFIDSFTTEIGVDIDGDGIIDQIDLEDMSLLTGNAPAYEHFNPLNADSDCVIGNPEEVMDNWHMQETDSSCAVASQEFVLEQLTGQNFEEGALRDLAEEFGWYTVDAGTPMDDVGNILEHMGLQVQRSQGNSFEELEQCLANGGEVIVCVDSDELWSGANDEWFGPGMDADHAVQVIGVDRTNPDEPMVILNDSGAANGCGAMVPLEDFMDAWEDSDCFMVEAYI